MTKKIVQLAGQPPVTSKLDDAEKARICRYLEQDKKPLVIAKLMKRSPSTIYHFLSSLESTAAYGKMLMERHISTLVERIIKESNVEQALEVVDRMGVPGLEKKHTAVSGGTQMTVVVGMPGHPAMIAPTQEVIEIERLRLEELHKPAIQEGEEHGTPRP